MSYSGWSNYETWATKLWLDNEQGTYYDVTGHASGMVEDASEMDSGPDVYDFATWLESYVDECVIGESQPSSGLAADLFRSAFQNIDWREMAESYLEDAKNESA